MTDTRPGGPAPAPDGRPWTRLDRPPLDERGLREALTVGPDPAWRAVEVTPWTGSTNADLVARARDGEAPDLVLATDDQRSGRGRLTREWTVPPRASLTLSVLMAPRLPTVHWGWIPLLTGLSVVRTLVRVAGLPAVLKWPNDVLVPVPRGGETGGGETRGDEPAKVCGILAESVATPSGSAVVVGIGLNVSQEADELPVPTATSLLLAGAATTDRNVLARALLRRLAADRAEWDDPAWADPERADRGTGARAGLRAAYRESCSTIGRRVEVQLPAGASIVGMCEGVDDDGRLLVRDDRGDDHRMAAGDVVHVRRA